MLESVKIQRRQSEIRQALAGLAAQTSPSEDETRQMDALDKEYRTNETRYRAALIAEDTERRDAGAELETRGGREWSDLCRGYELRQVALHLDEGAPLSGRTAEVVAELRSRGGYRGTPVPWEALERRADTVSTGVMNPVNTAPVIDRIFAESVASRMGTAFINVGAGEQEIPVATASVSASWAATEGGAIGDPVAFATVDRPLKPASTLGVQMSLTRKAMKQSGEALEAAVRRDMGEAMRVAMDAAVFTGSGASGQPTGVLNLTLSPVIPSTAVNARASYGMLRSAARRMMEANAAAGPADVRMLIRPLTMQVLDDTYFSGTAISDFDKLLTRFGAQNIVVTANALPAAAAEDATGKGAHKVLLTCTPGGVPAIYVAAWGAIDLIRDPYTNAKSGGLLMTALATMDVTVSRQAQFQILTGVQDRA